MLIYPQVVLCYDRIRKDVMRLTQHQDTRQISARVEELLSQMTLEEKIAQLCCCTLPDTLDDEAMSGSSPTAWGP